MNNTEQKKQPKLLRKRGRAKGINRTLTVLLMKDVDYYIVTHIHPDHIDMRPDGTVGPMLDKTVPVLVQDEKDGEVLNF